MKLALAILCIAAVVFLLRVLVAFVRDATYSSSHKAKFYLVRFVPSRRRAELVVMKPDVSRRDFATKTDDRIAT